MKKQNVSKSTISTYNTIKKIRNDWGNVNPITKVISNKKKNYEYPDSYYDYYEEDDYIYEED